MADPKIRYDIEAGIKGEPDVAQLATTVRRLGDTLDGDLKQQAIAAADALDALGAKRETVTTFQQLTNESSALAIELAEASNKVDALAQDLPAAAAATSRFAAAEAAARAQLDGATADFNEQRAALTALRTEFTGSARSTDAYREANAQLRLSVSELRTNLNEKKAALKAAATEATTAAAAERKLSTEYTAAAEAAFRTRGAVQDNTAALNASRNTLQSYGVATENLAAAERNLSVAIDQVRERVVSLAPAFATAAAQSNGSVQRQIADQKTLQTSIRGVQSELQKIQAIATVAIGGGFIGGMLKDVAATADEFKNLEARVKLATGEGDNFERSFRGVQEVALATHSALEETGTLFTRIAKTGTDAGLSASAAAEQSLALTTTINQAVQLSGSGADASKAAITQLIQGLQSGVLRGEEFNSVMEQAPRLAQALAQGLGVTTGELRKMAEQGALTSATVIKALTSQSAAVEAEFQKLPATVGRSLQDLSTQWTLYVGAADNGMASSANVAKIIDGLARNLDTLVSTLYAAGKAYAAFKVAGLALDAYKWATATIAATSAVTANTTAVTANTIAHGANAAAARASAAAGAANAATTTAATARIASAGGALGIFSRLLGPIGVGLAVLGPEIVGLGRWLGEGAAKWMGYGKAIEEAEASMRRQEEAAKANAAQQRLNAIALEESRNKQFELSKESAGLIGKFDEMRTKGDSAAEAIGKIGKDFDLASVPGIANAAAVLDKLAADGKISATQFQTAWSDALKGEDLAVFETKARAAFAGATREGERLAAVFDGTAREAIRRTGLEFDVLAGGIGRASRSAINDTDAIINNLDRLKAQGIDTGLALTASISKGISTADSQKAIEALRGQIEAVRKVLGDKIADGLLENASAKAEELRVALDEIKPGIQSTAEAFRTFGLETQEALDRVANSTRDAYDQLKQSGLATADQLRSAFEKTAQAAMAANKGVASGWVQTEDEITRARQSAQSNGSGRGAGGGRGGSSGGNNGFDQREQNRKDGYADQNVFLVDQNAARAAELAASAAASSADREKRLGGQNAVDASLQFRLRDQLKAGTLGVSDLGAIKAVIESLRQQNALNGSADKLSAGFMSLEGRRDAASWQATRAQLEALVKKLERPAIASRHVLELKVPGGDGGSVDMASEDEAAKLMKLLGQLKGRSS